MQVYKIKQKNSDLFVKGTAYYNSLDKEGRIFTKLSRLRSFITTCLRIPGRDLGNWEIVVYTLQVDNIKELHEVVKPEKIVELLKR